MRQPESQQSIAQRIFQPLIGIAVTLTVITCTATIAYLLTTAIYDRTNIQPSEWLRQVINALVAVSIAFLGLSVFMLLARTRGWAPELKAFAGLTAAIQRIAKGDFSVRLDNTFRGNEPLGDLMEEVNTMAAELARWEQTRQEFISNVSHEIQSPLTSIKGFAQALHNPQLSAVERIAYLDIITSESERLGRITDNLLQLATLEAERPKFEPREYRLDKQIRELILACEPQWSAKNIEMDVALDKVCITADDDLLSQVWINLLGNAIKFTPENGRIHVGLAQSGETVEVRIADNGIGIAAADLPRIFERFYKADKARTQAKGGSGLGLSIAKKIVEMHGGAITAQSEQESGTLFTVTLPQQSPAAQFNPNQPLVKQQQTATKVASVQRS